MVRECEYVHQSSLARAVLAAETTSLVLDENPIDMSNRANRNRLDVNLPNNFGKKLEGKSLWAAWVAAAGTGSTRRPPPMSAKVSTSATSIATACYSRGTHSPYAGRGLAGRLAP